MRTMGRTMPDQTGVCTLLIANLYGLHGFLNGYETNFGEFYDALLVRDAGGSQFTATENADAMNCVPPADALLLPILPIITAILPLP